MTATRWTLAQTLQRRGVSTLALIKASGLSKGTVYDIVNGKSQGITLETVDKLLGGLERLTGERLSVEAVLARKGVDTIQDSALLAQLQDLPLFDLDALNTTIPRWTPEQQEENRRQWMEHELDRTSRGNRRQEKLDALWEELDAPGDHSSDDEQRSA